MHKNELITPFSTRQYMFNKDYEIYYYSDKPGQAVSDHSHNYYEFYFFLEGNVNIIVEDQCIHVKPGDFLVIPPGIIHRPEYLDDTTPYRRFVLWISEDYCNGLVQASLDYGYIFQLISTTHEYVFANDIIEFNELQSRLFSITDEVKGHRFGKDARISLLINDLMISMNRMIYERRSSARFSSKGRLSESVAQYIETHLEDDLSLDRLELEFFISKYHISHSFKEEKGISVHKYIQMKRLEAARRAIILGNPVTEIYELYGFGDYSAFYRSYKKMFGESPAETARKEQS
ncbi:MAG: AraC family transcriptional regulator [Lachnospiraceae bacterium]|nr:AraC family transcriptional regulator [Lachnospiraceae bacterium]